MTRNTSPEGLADGGMIQRPGARSAHMPKVDRWMGGRQRPQEPNAAALTYGEEIAKAVGDLRAAIATLVPRVLGTQLYVLDSNGQATDQYRVPYSSLSIISESAKPLIVTSSPPIGSAPGRGPGVAHMPAETFAVLNLSGNVWTIYGGNAGDIVTVSAYALPQPPAAAKLVSLTPGPSSANTTQNATNPGAGAVIASISGAVLTALAPNGGLWQIAWTPALQGTVAAADANNMRLTSPLSTTLEVGEFPPVVGNYPQEPIQVLIPAGQGLNVQAIGAASGAAAIYAAQVVATLIGS
jgi:hypothetical protein